jgi:DNA repair protein RecN (Recombination protein N)
MLLELHVVDLGIVADLALLVAPGLTAITGETGAGKTLLVEALELLVGGRADTSLVRDGATEARVEGRFVDPESGDEVVLTRVVPREGRSRAYIDGRLATAGENSDRGASFVDLHGQHAHQSLLDPSGQRAALARFAGAPAVDALAA